MWLCDKGFYTKSDLAGALGVAQQSIDELPNCALLSDYLPGPRYRRVHACACEYDVLHFHAAWPEHAAAMLAHLAFLRASSA